MQLVFEAARTVLALSFLVYASLSDYKTREVSNTVWLLFAPPALILTLTELLLFESYHQLLLFGICIGLTSAFAIILFYAGGFGGADAKALMCLALALPFYPIRMFSPLSGMTSPISQLFFPITIFSNAVLLVVVLIVWIALRNMFWRTRTGRKLFEGTQRNESIEKKILVLITGYKMPINKLKEKWHVYPLEDVETNSENVRRKLVIVPKDEGRDSIIGRLEGAVNSGAIKDGIWASPGLPMLILITLGLIIALVFGDMIWSIIVTLLA